MTSLATSSVDEPDRLALVADDWTPLARSAAERFRQACLDEALAHDGRVDPNAVRERLLVGGVLDIDPRQFSALWSTAGARGGYLEKTDELVPITGPGSKHNGGKSIRIRRWIGDTDTPVAGADLGKAKPAAGQTPGSEVAPGPGPRLSDHTSLSGPTSPGGRDRSTRSHVAAPVTASPATGAVRFPADRQGIRRYGPHNVASAPTTSVVRCGGRSAFCSQPGCRAEHDVARPAVLVEQRRLVNEMAAR